MKTKAEDIRKIGVYSKELAEKVLKGTLSSVHREVLVYGISSYLRDMTCIADTIDDRKKWMKHLAENLDKDLRYLAQNCRPSNYTPLGRRRHGR